METEREPHRPLPKIEVVGQFRPYPTGQTPSELYLADALERQGAEVVRVGVNSKKKRDYDRDADVVVYAGPHRVSREDRPRTLKAFWTLDAPFAFNRADSFRRAAKECDVVFASGDWELRDRRGAAPVRIPAAVSAIDVDFDPDPIRNVAFLGTIYSERRREIANIIHSFSGEVFSAPGGKIYEGKLASYVQGTKIILGDNYTNDAAGYWSSRTYIIPGLGGFLLTAAVPGLEKEFGIGQHLATWSDLADLKAKIAYYLDHDAEREKIRADGFLHVQEHHTWDARARLMLRTLEPLCV